MKNGYRCDANRRRPCDKRKKARRNTRDRSRFPGLKPSLSRLLRSIADGYAIGIADGLCLIRDGVVASKARWRDVKALIGKGLLSPLFQLTNSAHELMGKVVEVINTPVLSVSEWCALPIGVHGKPASAIALTNDGGFIHGSRRVLAAGNSLSGSEALRVAAAKIGTVTT